MIAHVFTRGSRLGGLESEFFLKLSLSLIFRFDWAFFRGERYGALALLLAGYRTIHQPPSPQSVPSDTSGASRIG